MPSELPDLSAGMCVGLYIEGDSPTDTPSHTLPLEDRQVITVVGIVGSRDFPELSRVRSFVQALARKHPGAIVVSGGARGVDRVAEAEARRQGLALISLRPYEYDSVRDSREFAIERIVHGKQAKALLERVGLPLGAYYKRYGGAAFARNGQIVKLADHVIAFWDTHSHGTADTIARAKKKGKLARIYAPRLIEANEHAVLTEIERVFRSSRS